MVSTLTSFDNYLYSALWNWSINENIGIRDWGRNSLMFMESIPELEDQYLKNKKEFLDKVLQYKEYQKNNEQDDEYTVMAYHMDFRSVDTFSIFLDIYTKAPKEYEALLAKHYFAFKSLNENDNKNYEAVDQFCQTYKIIRKNKGLASAISFLENSNFQSTKDFQISSTPELNQFFSSLAVHDKIAALHPCLLKLFTTEKPYIRNKEIEINYDYAVRNNLVKYYEENEVLLSQYAAHLSLVKDHLEAQNAASIFLNENPETQWHTVSLNLGIVRARYFPETQKQRLAHWLLGVSQKLPTYIENIEKVRVSIDPDKEPFIAVLNIKVAKNNLNLSEIHSLMKQVFEAYTTPAPLNTVFEETETEAIFEKINLNKILPLTPKNNVSNPQKTTMKI